MTVIFTRARFVQENQFFTNMSVIFMIIRKIPIYYVIEEVITYKYVLTSNYVEQYLP